MRWELPISHPFHNLHTLSSNIFYFYEALGCVLEALTFQNFPGGSVPWPPARGTAPGTCKIFAHFVPRCMNSCNRRRLTSLQRYIFSAVFSFISAYGTAPNVGTFNVSCYIYVLVCYFCCSVMPVCTMAYLVCIQVCFSSLVPPCPSKSKEKYLVVRGDQRESQRAEGQAED